MACADFILVLKVIVYHTAPVGGTWDMWNGHYRRDQLLSGKQQPEQAALGLTAADEVVKILAHRTFFTSRNRKEMIVRE